MGELVTTDQPRGTVAPSTRREISSRRANLNDLEPVDRHEFASVITPALALVAPVGMTGDEQRTWLRAAYLALDGIPIALLERGAKAAMTTATHHSQIVPAILKEIREQWDWRRKHRPTAAELAAQHRPTMREIPPLETEIVKGMMKDLVAKLTRTNP